MCVENLPTVVSVACCTNLLDDFSYAICQTPVQAKTTASPVMVTNNDLHIVEEQFETNTTNTTSPMRVTNTTSPMRVTDTTSPMRVTNTASPMRVTDTTSPMRVTDTTSPMRVTDTTSPMRVTDTTSPMRVTNTTSPMRVTDIDLPIVVEPIEEQSITDIHDDAENENQICFINYGAEFQGLVITDQEIECHYYDIHTSLLNALSANDSYAILIFEGYMMALVKQRDNFYLFDSHARDSCGMPDPNGTAVVMKFSNIHELEQYLYSLSMELHTNIFEVALCQCN